MTPEHEEGWSILTRAMHHNRACRSYTYHMDRETWELCDATYDLLDHCRRLILVAAYPDNESITYLAEESAARMAKQFAVPTIAPILEHSESEKS